MGRSLLLDNWYMHWWYGWDNYIPKYIFLVLPEEIVMLISTCLLSLATLKHVIRNVIAPTLMGGT